HKLPELARGLGKLMAEFRKASNDFKMAFEEEMRNIERQNREAEWKKSQEEGEAKRQKELASQASAAVTAEAPGTGPAGTIEPALTPVREAVARAEGAGEPPPGSEPAAREDSPGTTPSDDASRAAADDSPAGRPAPEPNDQRQPA